MSIDRRGVSCMAEERFELVSDFEPTGDQPQAIEKLCEGIRRGAPLQTLLGVTGSGKTFTMANVIARLNRPTLVLAHNKTLAGQLYGEFKEFFPHNRVEYFVSYYDYYQPEAYVPQTDTYIEKDATVNAEIDKLRHSATASLFERRDVIVVASVSCIFGLGSPDEYWNQMLSLRVGQQKSRNELLRRLVEIQYDRNDIDFQRGTFRVRGDVIEVIPASQFEQAIRIELFGDEVERLTEIDVVTGEVLGEREHVAIFPASHYVTAPDRMSRAIRSIRAELVERLAELRQAGKLLEAERLEQRTNYDLEMMEELGFCSGIENYSRHIDGRKPGETPYCLLDYFPDDYLLFVDESHVTLPQVRGMYEGDRSRKEMLVEHGFRLPSALDNRPLKWDEFVARMPQTIAVSATPGDWELAHSAQVVEQLIRPTGLLDPKIEVRPARGQVDDLIGEVNQRIARQERVLITTLTKRMAEELTQYLKNVGIRVRYMHADIKALERMQIIRDLRLGAFDVLVGINLLREGLDLPEVSLVCILDADKEGFLRGERALIQTIGRAARNVDGTVILYGDTMTEAMRRAIDETRRRRQIQMAYNEEHHITPRTVEKAVRDLIRATQVAEEQVLYHLPAKEIQKMSKRELRTLIGQLRQEMKEAAQQLQFERAAELRDAIIELESELAPERKQKGISAPPSVASRVKKVRTVAK